MAGKLSVTQTIIDKLTDAFAPSELDVVDDSESHRGHGGYREGGESHFNVHMVSSKLNGLNRVAAQRAVYAVLKEELAGPIHALALDVRGDDQ